MQLDNLINKIQERPSITFKKLVEEVKDEKTLRLLVADLSKIYDDCCLAYSARPTVVPECVHAKARRILAEEKEEQDGIG
jgi:hypothetical protein